MASFVIKPHCPGVAAAALDDDERRVAGMLVGSTGALVRRRG
jgi:hypothetical protein